MPQPAPAWTAARLSLGLTLAAVAPVLVAGLAPAFADHAQTLELLRKVEYLLCAGAALTALYVALRPVRSSASPRGAATGPLEAHGAHGEDSGLAAHFWAFLPATPALAYMALFNQDAYQSLFLSDHDFTNMSAAFANTAYGRGFLATPFLATGDSASYLGHHFAPGLALFYAPIYAAYRALAWFAADPNTLAPAWRPTHYLYAVALWMTAAAGLWLWSGLALRLLRKTWQAALAMSVIAGAFLTWRLFASYHFEILALPLSAILFRAAGERKILPLCLALLLWLSVKEDFAVYAAAFGVFLSARPDIAGRRWYGALIAVSSIAWFLLVRYALMPHFAGASGVDWAHYWDADHWRTTRDLRPLFHALLAFALLPLLNLRFSAIVLAPLFLAHALSYQPWHQALLGHYGYALLPFLCYGWLLGFSRAERWFAIFQNARFPALAATALACLWLAAARDPYMPPPALKTDPRYAYLETLLRGLPHGACLQTQASFTAHAPIDLSVFPIAIPASNPWQARLPSPGRLAEFKFEPGLCERYYLLLEPSDAMPPFYSREMLAELERWARANLRLISAYEYQRPDGPAGRLLLFGR